MGTVLVIHSWVRWIIVVVAVVAVVKFAAGWLLGGRFGGMDRGLASGFSGLLDLQFLLGIILLLLAGLATFRIEHDVAMIVAVLVGHLPMRWKNAPDTERFRNTLIAVVAAVVIIVVGVIPLGGASRWTVRL